MKIWYRKELFDGSYSFVMEINGHKYGIIRGIENNEETPYPGFEFDEEETNKFIEFIKTLDQKAD